MGDSLSCNVLIFGGTRWYTGSTSHTRPEKAGKGFTLIAYALGSATVQTTVPSWIFVPGAVSGSAMGCVLPLTPYGLVGGSTIGVVVKPAELMFRSSTVERKST